jgi:Fic family protein
MQQRDFLDGFPGRLVSIGEGLVAFEPDALPNQLDLPASVWMLAGEAEKALGRLGGLLVGGGNPVSPQLVSRPLLRREAIESSRIEGTFTTPEQLVLFETEEGDSAQEANDETREVQNYLVALEWASQEMKRLPIGSRLIRGIHERLLQDVRGADQYPGEFRTIQNFIGRSQDPREARFVPPPPGRVPELIADLERYIHLPSEERSIARLARLALVHYQFETIHPFRDGNGRVGRILIPLLLQQEDPSDPPLYLSAYFESHRQDYYDLMLAVSQRGAYTEWIEFFLKGVVSSAHNSVELAGRLIALRAAYHQTAQDKRWPAACLALIDALFEHPVLTIRQVEQRVGVTTPTASAHLKKLEDAGMISEFTGRQRNRRYLALELLRLTHPIT